MKKIFVIGAGRSAPTLIKYLLDQSAENNWTITVGDVSEEMASKRVNGHENGRAIAFDVLDETQRKQEIGSADVVVSMLPPSMHLEVAKDCISLKKHMTTASYVSEEMKALNSDAKKAGVVLLNEIGVDPGLDHLSSMEIIDAIKSKGGKMHSFESFTGGLIAPESDDNPWNYKFTWNPRNVVLAGQGVVKFIQEGKYKYIPYHKVFNRIEKLTIPEHGTFEGYANRDSLKYRDIYGLDEIPTLYRGTLRRPGFCKAWDMFVQLGATDDSYIMEGTESMTHKDFINSFVLYHPGDSVKLKVAYHMQVNLESDEIEKLDWLGLFNDTPIGIKNGTPAQILQSILEKKWALQNDDKDMIAMIHRVFYHHEGKLKKLTSHLAVKGDDSTYTAMAKTVGLPLGIATKFVANGVISNPGVLLPISKEVYEPSLAELRKFGIAFNENEEC